VRAELDKGAVPHAPVSVMRVATPARPVDGDSEVIVGIAEPWYTTDEPEIAEVRPAAVMINCTLVPAPTFVPTIQDAVVGLTQVGLPQVDSSAVVVPYVIVTGPAEPK